MVNHKPTVPRKAETVFVKVIYKQTDIPPFQNMVDKLLDNDAEKYKKDKTTVFHVL